MHGFGLMIGNITQVAFVNEVVPGFLFKLAERLLL